MDADATDCLNVQNFILLYFSPKLAKLKNGIIGISTGSVLFQLDQTF